MRRGEGSGESDAAPGMGRGPWEVLRCFLGLGYGVGPRREGDWLGGLGQGKGKGKGDQGG